MFRFSLTGAVGAFLDKLSKPKTKQTVVCVMLVLVSILAVTNVAMIIALNSKTPHVALEHGKPGS